MSSEELLRQVQEAVLLKSYSLFDVSKKDEFSALFASLRQERRHEIFEHLKAHVEAGNIVAARAYIDDVLGKKKQVRAPSLMLHWVGFLVSMLIFVKTTLTLTFGVFGEDPLALITDLCLCALYITERLMEERDIGVIDVLVVLPGVLALVWKAPGLLMLIRCGASLWRFVLGLKAVGDGKWTRIFGLFCVFLLCGHVVSCLWFKLGLLQDHVVAFGPNDVFSNPTPLSYWRVYIFAMKALTQGPDGDPTTGLEIALSLVIMLLGFSVTASTVGSIGSVLMGLDAEREAWITKFDHADRYSRANALPDVLFRRISDYYVYLRNNKRSATSDQQEIFYELPRSLQTDISLHLTKDLLSKVSFFKGAPVACLSFVAQQLRPIAIPPGERVVTEGEVGTSMFFLMRGLLEVTSGLRIVSLLEEGAVFGEMALLIPGQPRTATIRALVFSDVFELLAEDLERVLQLWPSLRDALTKTMQERLSSSQEVREKVELTVGKEIEEGRITPALARVATLTMKNEHLVKESVNSASRSSAREIFKSAAAKASSGSMTRVSNMQIQDDTSKEKDE